MRRTSSWLAEDTTSARSEVAISGGAYHHGYVASGRPIDG